jgi:transposase
LLESYGHDVIVANARQVRVIYESDRKNDKVDARTLARLARIDKELLHPIRHRSEKAQADLAMLRARPGASPNQAGELRTRHRESSRGPAARRFGGILWEEGP